MPMVAATFAVALALAAVHLFAARLRFLDVIPRSRWLSVAGGVAVAYVFVHLLPELAESQAQLAEADNPVLDFLGHHAYLIALIGLTCFYGLERLVKQPRGQDGERPPTDGVFWLHVAAFSVYNALIGYLLLHREELSLASLFWYSFAMVLHFFVTDYGLRQDHQQAYSRVGRWVLAAAVLLGWALGALTEVHPLLVPMLTAFLAGGVILNVLKEELPEQRQSRFSAFLAGALGYAALLSAV